MKNNLLKKHAKSFYWASFFLSKDTFKKCSSLYNFCRTLDDIADDNINLKSKKENFFKFKKDFENKNLNNQIIKDMWSVIDSESISKQIIIDLFDGVETDLEEKVVINSKKDFKRAIVEFQKVFSYAGTDKNDDAQLKIGLCYQSIGNIDKAREEFQRMIDYFPGSEYYPRAREALKQLSID